jgi:hypothetical protein
LDPSPNTPFGGYEPSFVNPRTEEILSANIMLEFVHFTNRVFADKLYNEATANMKLETSEELAVTKFFEKKNLNFCSMGYVMHDNMQLGTAVLQATGASDLDMDALKKKGNEILNYARSWSYIRLKS